MKNRLIIEDQILEESRSYLFVCILIYNLLINGTTSSVSKRQTIGHLWKTIREYVEGSVPSFI
jgi:hypothetical protein